jgi:nickel-dependent lactate racemase
MRTVHLPYGTTGLDVEVPDSATVVEPDDPPAMADEEGAVTEALRSPTGGPPLEALVERSGDQKVVVVFPDITRPMPNTTVLPPLLAELERLGAGPERVELLCATGTHRRATHAEMSALVSPAILSRYRLHDHSATEDDHVVVGVVDGAEVRIDRRYVEADLRIVTGFVEPHFFAGFSGGPKAVCPGLADLGTILEAHSRRRISSPMATWTVMEGNPVHDFIRRATGLAMPALSLDVTIDRARRLTGVFCGPLPKAHEAACESVLRHSVSSVDGPFDVILTTNGGYPLDRNLYQAVKGMAAAERVVAQGGTIVVAAECVDGLPGGGAFEQLLAGARDASQLLAGGAAPPEAPALPDGWQAQVLGRVLSKAAVWLFAGGLDDGSVRKAQLRPVRDVGAAVSEALDRQGVGSRLCVLVRGPLAVATNVASSVTSRGASKGANSVTSRGETSAGSGRNV